MGGSFCREMCTWGTSLAIPHEGHLANCPQFYGNKVLQADLEFVSQGYGLEHCQSTSPCPHCRASSTEHPWTDLSTEATWRRTIHASKEEWLGSHEGACALFELEGLWVANLFLDIMHTKHLGVDTFILGSLLSFLVFQKDISLDSIWSEIRELYQVLGLPIAEEC